MRCVPRLLTANQYGDTYDSKGVVCGMSNQDKLTIGVGLSFCGCLTEVTRRSCSPGAALFLIVVLMWTGRSWRKKNKRRHEVEVVDTEAPLAKQPLMASWGQAASLPPTPQRPIRPQPVSFKAFTEGSDDSHFSSSSDTSPKSEVFHFPMLSATGELLPPPTAPASPSPRRLWGEVSDNGVLPIRPLPSPPSQTSSPMTPTGGLHFTSFDLPPAALKQNPDDSYSFSDYNGAPLLPRTDSYFPNNEYRTGTAVIYRATAGNDTS